MKIVDNKYRVYNPKSKETIGVDRLFYRIIVKKHKNIESVKRSKTKYDEENRMIPFSKIFIGETGKSPATFEEFKAEYDAGNLFYADGRKLLVGEIVTSAIPSRVESERLSEKEGYKGIAEFESRECNNNPTHLYLTFTSQQYKNDYFVVNLEGGEVTVAKIEDIRRSDGKSILEIIRDANLERVKKEIQNEKIKELLSGEFKVDGKVVLSINVATIAHLTSLKEEKIEVRKAVPVEEPIRRSTEIEPDFPKPKPTPDPVVAPEYTMNCFVEQTPIMVPDANDPDKNVPKIKSNLYQASSLGEYVLVAINGNRKMVHFSEIKTADGKDFSLSMLSGMTLATNKVIAQIDGVNVEAYIASKDTFDIVKSYEPTADGYSDNSYVKLKNGEYKKESELAKGYAFNYSKDGDSPDAYLFKTVDAAGATKFVVVSQDAVKKSVSETFEVEGVKIEKDKLVGLTRTNNHEKCDVLQTTSLGKNVEVCSCFKEHKDKVLKSELKDRSTELQAVQNSYKNGSYQVDKVVNDDGKVVEIDDRISRYALTGDIVRDDLAEKTVTIQALKNKKLNLIQSNNGECKVIGGSEFDPWKATGAAYKEVFSVAGAGLSAMLTGPGLLLAIGMAPVVSVLGAGLVLSVPILPIVNVIRAAVVNRDRSVKDKVEIQRELSKKKIISKEQELTQSTKLEIEKISKDKSLTKEQRAEKLARINRIFTEQMGKIKNEIAIATAQSRYNASLTFEKNSANVTTDNAVLADEFKQGMNAQNKKLRAKNKEIAKQQSVCDEYNAERAKLEEPGNFDMYGNRTKASQKKLDRLNKKFEQDPNVKLSNLKKERDEITDEMSRIRAKANDSIQKGADSKSEEMMLFAERMQAFMQLKYLDPILQEKLSDKAKEMLKKMEISAKRSAFVVGRKQYGFKFDGKDKSEEFELWKEIAGIVEKTRKESGVKLSAEKIERKKSEAKNIPDVIIPYGKEDKQTEFNYETTRKVDSNVTDEVVPQEVVPVVPHEVVEDVKDKRSELEVLTGKLNEIKLALSTSEKDGKLKDKKIQELEEEIKNLKNELRSLADGQAKTQKPVLKGEPAPIRTKKPVLKGEPAPIRTRNPVLKSEDPVKRPRTDVFTPEEDAKWHKKGARKPRYSSEDLEYFKKKGYEVSSVGVFKNDHATLAQTRAERKIKNYIFFGQKAEDYVKPVYQQKEKGFRWADDVSVKNHKVPETPKLEEPKTSPEKIEKKPEAKIKFSNEEIISTIDSLYEKAVELGQINDTPQMVGDAATKAKRRANKLYKDIAVNLGALKQMKRSLSRKSLADKKEDLIEKIDLIALSVTAHIDHNKKATNREEVMKDLGLNPDI